MLRESKKGEDKMSKQNKLTRRQFIKDAAIAGAAVAATGVLGASPAVAAPGIPDKWDKEAEIVIVGFGGAGACAAIDAADAGAKVLILEKQAADTADKINQTSNTRQASGAFICPSNVNDAVAYMSIASRVNVEIPESKDIDDETIKAWAEYSAQNKDWLTKLGALGFIDFYNPNVGRDPSWPGNSAIQAFQIKRADGAPGVGFDLFNFLADKVKARKIEVMYESPAKRLIANPKGEVVGVKVQSKSGEINIKASKAVILTCGGFEYNESMKKAYWYAYPMVVDGNPANTGDGIQMALDVGADLWHMTTIGGGFKMRFPDFPVPFRPDTSLTKGAIAVDKTGKRFKAENELGGYSGFWNAIVYDTVKYAWPRIPVWWIFDEKRRTANPMVSAASAAAGPIGLYKWSKDNSEEIKKGWIISANTIQELAQKIKVDPAVLQDQVDKYNSYAKSGKDADFPNRPAATLIALDAPPFYAMQFHPGPNNTFGGPRRNAKAQIVNAYGEPISRLYSAGELGSIFVQYPQGGANIGECIAFGRIAAKNAVAEKPW
jgi:3-oxosteroid 1-dehydrogenase